MWARYGPRVSRSADSAVSLILEPVADAADGDRDRRAGGAQLVAQARQVRLEPQRIGIVHVRPAGGQQIGVRARARRDAR